MEEFSSSVIVMPLLLCWQLSFLVQKQKFLELLSWQSGGEQRMAFPPWKPLAAALGDGSATDMEKVEMGAILQQLNVLKGLCSTPVKRYDLTSCVRWD